MKFGRYNPRYYPSPDGSKVPSVTTILSLLNKQALIAWSAREAVRHIRENIDSVYDMADFDDICTEAEKAYDRNARDAAVTGTDVHGLIEKYLRGFEFDLSVYDDRTRKMVSNAIKWLKMYRVEPIEVEAEINNGRWAGRVDLICKIDSRAWENKRWCKKRGLEYPQPNTRVTACIDIKTTSSYYPEMPLQLAAYADAYGERIGHIGILRIDKKSCSANYKDYTDEREQSLRGFECLCDFWWNFDDELKGQKNEQNNV